MTIGRMRRGKRSKRLPHICSQLGSGNPRHFFSRREKKGDLKVVKGQRIPEMRKFKLLRDQIATGPTVTHFVSEHVHGGARLHWGKSNIDYDMPKDKNRGNARRDA